MGISAIQGFSDENMDIYYTSRSDKQKEYILSPDFCPVICFFMPASVTSAKHADIGLFSLFIGAHED
jgi:hypothetical protein